MSGNVGRVSRHLVHDEEVDSDGTWAISYGDMVTLLLCFFILFFQIKPEEESVTRFQHGLTEKMAQKSIPQEQTGGGGGVPSISLGKGEEVGIEQALLKRLNGVAHEKGNSIIIEFPGISFFPSGETELTFEGRKALEEFSKSYLGFESKHVIGIRAFTDMRGVRHGANRAFRDNLELSALRAVSTMRILVREGIPMALVRLGGFGELKVTAQDLEKYVIEREKESVVKEAEKFEKEIRRLEAVIASHRTFPLAGTPDQPELSAGQIASIKLAETKIETATKNKQLASYRNVLAPKDHNFLRDKLARTVVLVIEPKGETQ